MSSLSSITGKTVLEASFWSSILCSSWSSADSCQKLACPLQNMSDTQSCILWPSVHSCIPHLTQGHLVVPQERYHMSFQYRPYLSATGWSKPVFAAYKQFFLRLFPFSLTPFSLPPTSIPRKEAFPKSRWTCCFKTLWVIKYQTITGSILDSVPGHEFSYL